MVITIGYNHRLNDLINMILRNIYGIINWVTNIEDS